MNIEQRNSYREKILSLEQKIAEDLPSIECPVKHHFADGTYTREMFIPAGTLLTGKIHRHSCINILAQGRIVVVSDEGRKEISAPHVFVSGPGVKKAGFALEDSVWINVHPWNGRDDVDQIEEKVIVPSYEALDQEERPCLGEQ